MPVYCYSTKDRSDTREEQYAMGEAPYSIRYSDGTMRYRDIAAEHRGSKDTPGNWPMASYAAGVHPSQRQEAMTKLNKLGVPTYYNEQGDPVLTSPRHRKAFCKATGLFDRNAGYGDRAPENL